MSRATDLGFTRDRRSQRPYRHGAGADPDAAIKAAIRKYDIAPEHQHHVAARRSCAVGSAAGEALSPLGSGRKSRRFHPAARVSWGHHCGPWHPDVKLGPSLSYTILDMIRWYSLALSVKSAGEGDRASCSRKSRPCPEKQVSAARARVTCWRVLFAAVRQRSRDEVICKVSP